jgi:hypothetical protein
MPADAPIWCAAFDEMGEAGILSVAATANNPVDVDAAGDLPTACPSNFLISVTSLDKKDEKAANAAWGAFNIDLGAYGEEAFSTLPGNQYGHCYGTSFAAPQVSAAIGLLYASPCPELIALAKTNPKAAADWAKGILLNSATPNQDLAGRSLTGGRLNVYAALEKYQQQCAACPAPFALWSSISSPFTAQLNWTELSGYQSVILRWRKKGELAWNYVEHPIAPYELEGLKACTNYEYSLRATCYNGEISNWSAVEEFVTLGCCEAPTFNYLVTNTQEGTQVVWDDLYGFALYKIRVYSSDSTYSASFLTTDTNYIITGLEGCKHYHLIIDGWCFNEWIPLNTNHEFISIGCGSCTEKTYCPIAVHETQEEWIASLKIGEWFFNSGWGGGGYQDFTSEAGIGMAELRANTSIDIAINPGFWGAPYKEYYRIFIDYNQDGDFDDDQELAFDPGFALEGSAVGKLMVPELHSQGNTRMRVIMKYFDGNQSPPLACESFDFGQVEDYCVRLEPGSTDAKISGDSLLTLNIYPLPASDWAFLEIPLDQTSDLQLKVWDISGRSLGSPPLQPLRNNLAILDVQHWLPGVYFLAIEGNGQILRAKLIKQ